MNSFSALSPPHFTSLHIAAVPRTMALLSELAVFAMPGVDSAAQATAALGARFAGQGSIDFTDILWWLDAVGVETRLLGRDLASIASDGYKNRLAALFNEQNSRGNMMQLLQIADAAKLVELDFETGESGPFCLLPVPCLLLRRGRHKQWAFYSSSLSPGDATRLAVLTWESIVAAQIVDGVAVRAGTGRDWQGFDGDRALCDMETQEIACV